MEILTTTLPNLQLVAPDIERDAPLAVQWLSGEAGRNTLLLMGNLPSSITAPSLPAEQARVQQFIDLEREHKQLTWMMRFQQKVVGAVWVELQPTEYLAAPALHIMIGDTTARGHGVGMSSVAAVIAYLKADGQYPQLYSRHLSTNQPAGGLLKQAEFQDDGVPYQDHDNLLWQNMRLDLAA